METLYVLIALLLLAVLLFLLIDKTITEPGRKQTANVIVAVLIILLLLGYFGPAIPVWRRRL